MNPGWIVGPGSACGYITSRCDVTRCIVRESEVCGPSQGRVVQTIQVIVVEIFGESDVVVLTLNKITHLIEQIRVVLQCSASV